MSSLEAWFLSVLACPRCHERVELTPAEDGLRCDRCAVVYAIEGGIPQMLPDSGRPVEPRDRS